MRIIHIVIKKAVCCASVSLLKLTLLLSLLVGDEYLNIFFHDSSCWTRSMQQRSSAMTGPLAFGLIALKCDGMTFSSTVYFVN